jgi:hypothetical protein
MRRFNILARTFLILSLIMTISCNDYLDEINVNPNGIDPATANPNLLLPNILSSTAMSYLSLGYGTAGGVMQHTQKDGWYSSHNHYDWGLDDWTGWYGILRNNELLLKRAVELKYPFHEGIALTMKAFVFGVITDLWGDAPYTDALKGSAADAQLFPKYDNQEIIYKGIIEDLKKASELFGKKDVTGMINANDVFYAGNIANWQKFANSLLLRYYMRVSAKLPDFAKSGIESVYSSGIYLKASGEDAVMDYPGTIAGNAWPENTVFDASESNWRRIKPGKSFIDLLKQLEDPRLKVWFAPVHVRWVADPNLEAAVDEFIRKDGVIMQGTKFMTDIQFRAEVAKGHKFTRHYNPNKIASTLIIDTDEYLGVPAGMLQPDYYNNNPTPGQEVQNQHVSQLSAAYRAAKGGILKARLASAAETAFILAEAAKKGYNVGSAEGHYNNGIKNSLDTWGVGTQYSTYITKPGVAFNNTEAQILNQKWIASWTMATEAWFDYRRTGLPALKAGPASAAPALPIRFNYGNNEISFNNANVTAALDAIEVTPYSGQRGKNSQWSKPWLIKGTGKPW